MKRVDGLHSLPNGNGLGKTGWQDYNAATGVMGTIPTAATLNAWQEELCGLIESQGLPLNPADNTQLQQAVQAMIATVQRGMFAVGPTEPASLTLTVAAGWLNAATSVTYVAAQTVTEVSPTGNPRIDLVVANRQTGAVSLVQGLAATSPVAPACPAANLPLATVTITAAATAITAAMISDCRDLPAFDLGAAAYLNIGAGLVNDGAGNLALSATSYGVVGSMRNLKASVTAPATSATWIWDELIVETALGGTSYRLTNTAGLTLNLGATGAGGMDTGGAPAAGWLGVYAIYNPSTGAKALLGVDATSAILPNVYGGAHMPAGYTASALISIVPTDGSSQIAKFDQCDRKVWYLTSFLSVSGDNAPHTISIAGSVPKSATTFDASISLGGASVAGNYIFNISQYSDGTGAYQFGGYMQSGTGIYSTITGIPISTPQTTTYISPIGMTQASALAYTF